MAAAQATGCQEQNIFMYDVYFKITHYVYVRVYIHIYIYMYMYDVYNTIHVHISFVYMHAYIFKCIYVF